MFGGAQLAIVSTVSAWQTPCIACIITHASSHVRRIACKLSKQLVVLLHEDNGLYELQACTPKAVAPVLYTVVLHGFH